MDAEGELRHEGNRIQHPGLHALFQSALDVHASGEAIVRIGDQWAYVGTPGTPFVVQRCRLAGTDLSLDLNTGETVNVAASQAALHLQGEHELTLQLPTPGRSARFGRRAWHALAENLELGNDGQLWLNLPEMRLPVARS